MAAAGEVGQLVREQARREQHSPGERERGRGPQELRGAGVDTVVVVLASGLVALIRGAVTGIGAQLALEAVEDEQDAALLERPEHEVELLAVGKTGGRIIARPDVASGPVEEGAEVGVSLVERPEEHALRPPVLGDAEVFRVVRLRVAGGRGAQHVRVQPEPGQSRLAHASNGLDHADRPRSGGEPLREPLALGDAAGEVALQRVRVGEVGREPLACLWNLLLSRLPRRGLGRGRFRFGRLRSLPPLRVCFRLFFSSLLQIDPNKRTQSEKYDDRNAAPPTIGLKETKDVVPDGFLKVFGQSSLDERNFRVE